MDKPIEYTIQELPILGKRAQNIEAFQTFKSVRFYKVKETAKYIAVMQLSKFDISLKEVSVIDFNGTCSHLTLERIEPRIDKKYKLYDLVM